MKLKGEIIQVIKENRTVSVTINIDTVYVPRNPTIEDVNYDDERLGKAMEIYEKKLKNYNEYQKAIESLGIRDVTIEFGSEE